MFPRSRDLRIAGARGSDHPDADALLLDRQGLAELDQTFATLSGGQFADTDHKTGDVGFPVVLGDLQRSPRKPAPSPACTSTTTT